MAALARANEVRARRSELKADLKAGEVLLSEVLLSEADWLQGMRIREILLATPKIGKHRADRALQATWLSATIRLGRASMKSRERLLEALVERSPKIRIAPDSWKAAA